MRFAYIIMGDFGSGTKRAKTANGKAVMIGVSDIAEAVICARELADSGIGCIELCGAFGESGAKAIIEATENKIPVGYVTHLPEQNDIYASVFGE